MQVVSLRWTHTVCSLSVGFPTFCHPEVSFASVPCHDEEHGVTSAPVTDRPLTVYRIVLL